MPELTNEQDVIVSMAKKNLTMARMSENTAAYYVKEALAAEVPLNTLARRLGVSRTRIRTLARD